MFMLYIWKAESKNVGALNQEVWNKEAFCIAEIYGIGVKTLRNYLNLNYNSILSLKSCFSCTILQWCLYSSDPEAFSVCPLSEYTNKLMWSVLCMHSC